jgi:hypothetical protein
MISEYEKKSNFVNSPAFKTTLESMEIGEVVTLLIKCLNRNLELKENYELLTDNYLELDLTFAELTRHLETQKNQIINLRHMINHLSTVVDLYRKTTGLKIDIRELG